MQNALQLYERSLQLTKERMQAGIASGADVAQAETQLESTRAQYIDLGVARAQFEHAIAVLTGQPPAALSIPSNPIAMPPSVSMRGLERLATRAILFEACSTASMSAAARACI